MELLKQLNDDNVIVFPDFGTYPSGEPGAKPGDEIPVKAILELNKYCDPGDKDCYKIHIFKMDGTTRIEFPLDEKHVDVLIERANIKQKPFLRSKYPEMDNVEDSDEDYDLWYDDLVGDVFDIGEKIENLIAREYKKIETKYLKKKVPLGKIRKAFLAEFRDMPLSPPDFPIKF